MGGETQTEAQRSRFLLGEASEAERERLESEFFSDEDAFQEMLTAEDDLIDAYARGELSAKEHRQFEERFLNSSQGRERVQFARDLAAASGPRPIVIEKESTNTYSTGFFASIFGRAPLLQGALATVAIASMVGFSGLLVERSRMNEELRELRAEHTRLSEKAEELQRTAELERARNAETTAQLEDLQRRTPRELTTPANPSPAEQITKKLPEQKRSPNRKDLTPDNQFTAVIPDQNSVVFDLTGSVRSGSGNTLNVPRGATSISLRVALESAELQGNYRAVIETPEGRTLWRNLFKVNRNTAEGTHLLKVPAKNLPPGDYILSLSGERSKGVFEEIASYSFRVARQ